MAYPASWFFSSDGVLTDPNNSPDAQKAVRGEDGLTIGSTRIPTSVFDNLNASLGAVELEDPNDGEWSSQKTVTGDETVTFTYDVVVVGEPGSRVVSGVQFPGQSAVWSLAKAKDLLTLV